MLFGATILAAATSLPEVSTGLTAVRAGDYQLAVSDIFGGNAFLPVLFLLATSSPANPSCRRPGHRHLPDRRGDRPDAGLRRGLLFRPGRRHARMGLDSIAVLVLYVIGLAGLVAIASS